MNRTKQVKSASWAAVLAAVMIVFGYTATSAQADLTIDFEDYNVGDILGAGQPDLWTYQVETCGGCGDYTDGPNNIVDTGGGNEALDQTGLDKSYIRMSNLAALEPNIGDGTKFSVEVYVKEGANGETPNATWNIQATNQQFQHAWISFEGSGVNRIMVIPRVPGQDGGCCYYYEDDSKFLLEATLDFTNEKVDYKVTNMDSGNVVADLPGIDMVYVLGGAAPIPGPAGVQELAFRTFGGAGTTIWDNFQVIIPEPASLVLLGLGGLMMLRRRR